MSSIDAGCRGHSKLNMASAPDWSGGLLSPPASKLIDFEVKLIMLEAELEEENDMAKKADIQRKIGRRSHPWSSQINDIVLTPFT